MASAYYRRRRLALCLRVMLARCPSSAFPLAVRMNRLSPRRRKVGDRIWHRAAPVAQLRRSHSTPSTLLAQIRRCLSRASATDIQRHLVSVALGSLVRHVRLTSSTLSLVCAALSAGPGGGSISVTVPPSWNTAATPLSAPSVPNYGGGATSCSMCFNLPMESRLTSTPQAAEEATRSK